MADIIKTWPANVNAHSVAALFDDEDAPFTHYYFTLGRGMPKQPVERIWWTYQGRIIGWFNVEKIVVNDGTLPRLSRIDGGESEWQIAKDAKVAICKAPCHRVKERVYMSGFRGFRYFNFDEYKGTLEAKCRL